MAEVYGFGPDKVNSLTLFQLAILLGAITPEHGRVKVSAKAAQSIISQRQAKRAGLNRNGI